MKKTELAGVLALIIFFMIGLHPSLYAQRTHFSKQEYINRRQALMDQVEDGFIILFGEARYIRSADLNPGSHFRQDPDFYYFTGCEDQHSALIMTPADGRSYLFLPRQTDREVRSTGANLLRVPNAKEKTGFSEIYELDYLDEFLARSLSRYGWTFHMRLIPRSTLLYTARRSKLHYNDRVTLDNYRIQKFHERFPAVEFKDVSSAIDELRVIKSREEIEVLRRIGKISAEGVRQAMLATRPGGWEYEIEGAAVGTIISLGSRGPGYPPIVASGLNACTLHYSRNADTTRDGDLVLMDFGGELDYLMVDISRTWPVSGKFSPEQREAYRVCLEVEKACIEAYRPGVTTADVQKHVADTMKAKGIDARGQRGGIGHYVGMEVHDVGPRGVALREGMVFAIEPGLYYPDKSLGIRVEDTVLITRDGCEVLSRDVPKEIDAIEKLLSKRR